MVFVGFPPCLHHNIRGILTVYTLCSWDSHRVYIIFVGFPPYIHYVRGISAVCTSSYAWDPHRIYIVFVRFPPYLDRIPWIPISFPEIRNPVNPPFPFDEYVYAWYSSLYFPVIGLWVVDFQRRRYVLTYKNVNILYHWKYNNIWWEHKMLSSRIWFIKNKRRKINLSDSEISLDDCSPKQENKF